MRAMFIAQLICSEPPCTEEYEARAATLAELEALACDCGCGLQLVRVAEGEHDGRAVTLELLVA
jgi:hypothetical protein